LDALAKMAAADPTAPGNPVPVGPAELKSLYEASLAGNL
jgi:alcohol dehydrogenase class IV